MEINGREELKYIQQWVDVISAKSFIPVAALVCVQQGLKTNPI